MTDLPSGPWGGAAGLADPWIIASAEHKYRGELYETDGVGYRSQVVEYYLKMSKISMFMHFNLIL